MGAAGGPLVYNSTSAKANIRSNGYVAVRESISGSVDIPRVYVDVTSDANEAWFLVFMAYAYRDWETDRKSTRLNSSHRL